MTKLISTDSRGFTTEWGKYDEHSRTWSHVEYLDWILQRHAPADHPLMILIEEIARDYPDDRPSLDRLRKVLEQWAATPPDVRRLLTGGWNDAGTFVPMEVLRQCCGMAVKPVAWLTLNHEKAVQSYVTFVTADSFETVKVEIQHGASQADVLSELDAIRAHVAANWKDIIVEKR